MLASKHVRNFVIFFEMCEMCIDTKFRIRIRMRKFIIRKIIGNFTQLYSILYNFVKFYTIIWIFIQVYKCLCNYTKFRISHSHAKFLYNYLYLWIGEKKIRFCTSLLARHTDTFIFLIHPVFEWSKHVRFFEWSGIWMTFENCIHCGLVFETLLKSRIKKAQISHEPDRCGFYLRLQIKFRFSNGRPNHVFRLNTRPFKIRTSSFRYSDKSGFWVSDFQMIMYFGLLNLFRVLAATDMLCYK